jgi:hypothetical protein
VSEVEVDEVFRLYKVISLFRRHYNAEGCTVSDEAAKVSTDNAVPSGALPTVELRNRQPRTSG